MKTIFFSICIVVCWGCYPVRMLAQEVGNVDQNAAAIARQTANPIADIKTIPFQFNFNFGMGNHKRMQTVVNFMPVIPFPVSKNINAINRLIIPIINMPEFSDESGSTFGLGDINYSMLFTPADVGKLIWGIGPAVNIPTRTNNELGSSEFGIGPSFVVLVMPGNWALGLTANNVWSYENGYLNALFSQVFITYTFPGAWFVNFAPTITANWNAEKGEQWTVPLSFNIGKLKLFGGQPIKFLAGGSYFLEKPSYGPDWQLNFQVVFIFAKK